MPTYPIYLLSTYIHLHGGIVYLPRYTYTFQTHTFQAHTSGIGVPGNQGYLPILSYLGTYLHIPTRTYCTTLEHSLAVPALHRGGNFFYHCYQEGASSFANPELWLVLSLSGSTLFFLLSPPLGPKCKSFLPKIHLQLSINFLLSRLIITINP